MKNLIESYVTEFIYWVGFVKGSFVHSSCFNNSRDSWHCSSFNSKWSATCAHQGLFESLSVRTFSFLSTGISVISYKGVLLSWTYYIKQRINAQFKSNLAFRCEMRTYNVKIPTMNCISSHTCYLLRWRESALVNMMDFHGICLWTETGDECNQKRLFWFVCRMP